MKEWIAKFVEVRKLNLRLLTLRTITKLRYALIALSLSLDGRKGLKSGTTAEEFYLSATKQTSDTQRR
jgi:hypothetical protein